MTFTGQLLWASIGYTLAALLGACTARPGRRGVLLIGDGAAQMTVHEPATVVRGNLPAVVVVDNDGYTVERAIHGADQLYNDISRWDWDISRCDWTRVPEFFAAGPGASAVRAETVGELAAALEGAQARPDRFRFIQAVVPRAEILPLLQGLTRALSQASRRPSP